MKKPSIALMAAAVASLTPFASLAPSYPFGTGRRASAPIDPERLRTRKQRKNKKKQASASRRRNRS